MGAAAARGALGGAGTGAARVGWFIPRVNAPADAPVPTDTPTFQHPSAWGTNLSAAGRPLTAAAVTTVAPRRILLAPRAGLVWTLTGFPTVGGCAAGAGCAVLTPFFVTSASGETVLSLAPYTLKAGFVYRVEARGTLTATWAWSAPPSWPPVLGGPIAGAAWDARDPGFLAAAAAGAGGPRSFDPAEDFLLPAAALTARPAWIYVRPPPAAGTALLAPAVGTAYVTTFDLTTDASAWILEPPGVLSLLVAPARLRAGALAAAVGAPVAAARAVAALALAASDVVFSDLLSSLRLIAADTLATCGTATSTSAASVAAAAIGDNVFPPVTPETLCTAWSAGAAAETLLADAAPLPLTATTGAPLVFSFRADAAGSSTALAGGYLVNDQTGAVTLSPTQVPLQTLIGVALGGHVTGGGGTVWAGFLPPPASSALTVWGLVIATAADGSFGVAAARADVTSPLNALGSDTMALATLAKTLASTDASLAALSFASSATAAAASSASAGGAAEVAAIAAAREALGVALAATVSAAITAAATSGGGVLAPPALSDNDITLAVTALLGSVQVAPGGTATTATTATAAAALQAAGTALSTAAALASVAGSTSAADAAPLPAGVTAMLLRAVSQSLGTVVGGGNASAQATRGAGVLADTVASAILGIAGAALRGVASTASGPVFTSAAEGASSALGQYCGPALSIAALRMGGTGNNVAAAAAAKAIAFPPISPCVSAGGVVAIPPAVLAAAPPISLLLSDGILAAMSKAGAKDAAVVAFGTSPNPEVTAGGAALLFTAPESGRGSTGPKIAPIEGRRLERGESLFGLLRSPLSRALGLIESISAAANYLVAASGAGGIKTAYGSTLAAAAALIPLNSTTRDLAPMRPLDTRVVRIELGIAAPFATPAIVTLPWRDPSIIAWPFVADATTAITTNFKVGQTALNAASPVINITCPLSLAAALAGIKAVYAYPKALVGVVATVRYLNSSKLSYTAVSAQGTAPSAGLAGAGGAMVTTGARRGQAAPAQPAAAGVTLSGVAGLAYVLSASCGPIFGEHPLVCGPGLEGKSVAFACPRAVAVAQCVVWVKSSSVWSPSAGCVTENTDATAITCACSVNGDVAARVAVLSSKGEDVFASEVPLLVKTTWSAHALLLVAMGGLVALGAVRGIAGARADEAAHLVMSAELLADKELAWAKTAAAATGRAWPRPSNQTASSSALVAPAPRLSLSSPSSYPPKSTGESLVENADNADKSSDDYADKSSDYADKSSDTGSINVPTGFRPGGHPALIDWAAAAEAALETYGVAAAVEADSVKVGLVKGMEAENPSIPAADSPSRMRVDVADAVEDARAPATPRALPVFVATAAMVAPAGLASLLPAFDPQAPRLLRAAADVAVLLGAAFFAASFYALLAGARGAGGLTAGAGGGGWAALSLRETLAVAAAATLTTLALHDALRLLVRAVGARDMRVRHGGVYGELHARGLAERILAGVTTQTLSRGLGGTPFVDNAPFAVTNGESSPVRVNPKTLTLPESSPVREVAGAGADVVDVGDAAVRSLIRDAAPELDATSDCLARVAARARLRCSGRDAALVAAAAAARARADAASTITTPAAFAAMLAAEIAAKPFTPPLRLGALLIAFLLGVVVFFAYYVALFGFVTGSAASLSLLGAWAIQSVSVPLLAFTRSLLVAQAVARAANDSATRFSHPAAARPLRARIALLAIPRAAAAAARVHRCSALLLAGPEPLAAAAALVRGPLTDARGAARAAFLARWFLAARIAIAAPNPPQLQEQADLAGNDSITTDSDMSDLQDAVLVLNTQRNSRASSKREITTGDVQVAPEHQAPMLLDPPTDDSAKNTTTNVTSVRPTFHQPVPRPRGGGSIGGLTLGRGSARGPAAAGLNIGPPIHFGTRPLAPLGAAALTAKLVLGEPLGPLGPGAAGGALVSPARRGMPQPRGGMAPRGGGRGAASLGAAPGLSSLSPSLSSAGAAVLGAGTGRPVAPRGAPSPRGRR